MRLGANVFGFKNAAEWARLHVEKGYGAAYWPLRDDADENEIRDYVNAAADADLVIAEVGIWNNLIDPDLDKRRANFERAVRRFETAEKVGARCCVNVSGSRGEVWYGAHPKNLTPETFDMIVDYAQRLIDTVKPQRTCFTLEPMQWMYPHDENDALNLIKAIDREAFQVHTDMANLINSYDKYIATGDVTKKFFNALGGHIRSVHLKDIKINEKILTVHIDEVMPGTGEFDFETLFDCCNKLNPDLPMMIEHLSGAEKYDRAAAFFKGVAEKMGLSFIAARG